MGFLASETSEMTEIPHAAPSLSRLRSNSNLLAIVALVILLVAASILRVVALGRVPLGLNQDEACDGYDAYCLLQTGRDQAGNWLPITIQALNDYRMPLFDYSLVPVLGVFGLDAASVRFGAALWGIADLVALALLGWLMFGVWGSAIVVVLAALSPWHLPLSRFGTGVITAAATTTEPAATTAPETATTAPTEPATTQAATTAPTETTETAATTTAPAATSTLPTATEPTTTAGG